LNDWTSNPITENNNLQITKNYSNIEVEQLKSILFGVNDKVAILNDENIIILQEKAMLQGQILRK